jgi:putative FmdB family regulatory protein
MPLYDYECPECRQRFEHFLTLAEDKASGGVLRCPVCGEDAKKIIVLGHGGFMRPDSPWVKDAARVLSDSDKPLPIENTTQLRRFLERNPNIVPADHHPAMPSRVGDIERRPSPEVRQAQMVKQAQEHLYQRRSISLNTAAAQA